MDQNGQATAGTSGKPDTWTATNGSTPNITFHAVSTFQLHVPYTASGGMKNGLISFTKDMYNISSISNKTSITVTITNAEKMPSLEMMFVSDGKTYWMTDLVVMFTFDNKIFPNITNPSNKTITASMKNGNVFMTNRNNSYKCSLDTQLELDTDDNLKAWFQMSGIQLEAFKNNSTFSPPSLCFADQTPTSNTSVWDFKEKTSICARIYAKAWVNITYKQISGESRDTTIVFPADAMTTATCSDTKVSGTVPLDGEDVKITLEYNKDAKSKTYDLNAVSLMYNSKSKFFPNIPSMSNSTKISNTTLMVQPTPVNMSYLCLVDETLTITPELSLMMSNPQWQAFGTIPAKGFAKASDCSAMQTTPAPTVTTPHPDPIVPSPYQWTASDGKKVCFLANAGFQFRASYMKTGAKTPTMVWFDFDNNTDTISSTNCSKDTFDVTIENWGNKTSRNQSVVLTFSKQENKTKYALTKVQIKFQLNNATFVNATSLNQTVMVTSDPKIMLMPTKLNETYTCTIETQVSATGNESSSKASNVFLRIHNVTELQAFATSEKISAKKSECFLDQKRPPAKQGDWKVKDAKKNVCARVQSTLSITVAYHDIMDKIIFVTIPIEGDKVGVLESKCAANTTTLTLDVDRTKMINLTLTYKKTKPMFYTSAPAEDYVLNNVTLEYKSDNWNFQNHKDYGKQVTVTSESGLNWFSTPVGRSYRCDLHQQESVGDMTNNQMTLSLANTRWEAFSINKTGDFSEGRYCAAERSTPMPMTTAPVTPQPHIPSEPIVSKILVKASDNKTVCLLAEIGLQIRMNYNMTNSSALADIGFNMNPNETHYSGVCGGDSSIVTFYNHHDQQLVNLTFTKKANNTYLSSVSVEYNISSLYPHVNNKSAAGNPYRFSVSNLMELSAPVKHAYNCTDEADFLIDVGNNVIVRITGVKLQAFDVEKAAYSTIASCLPDTLPTMANTGNWTITENNTACARYMFAATFNITYPTVLGTQLSILIPLDNATTNYVGKCGKEQSYFWVKMEEITFTFFFNKTDISGNNFNYHMFAVVVNYNLPSKYFPNHAYDSDNQVQLGNSTLEMFSSRNDRSYKCATVTSIKLNATLATVQFKDVQVQPFGVEKDGGFSTAENCSGDMSPIIPIIVGAVLAFLVVLVLGAYFIGRKRAARVEYETI